ncbi:MAG: hypothetical protein ACREJ0_15245 [Geminicoccaceae bacterium]
MDKILLNVNPCGLDYDVLYAHPIGRMQRLQLSVPAVADPHELTDRLRLAVQIVDRGCHAVAPFISPLRLSFVKINM